MYILILHNNTPLCIMMHNTPFNGMLKKKNKIENYIRMYTYQLTILEYKTNYINICFCDTSFVIYYYSTLYNYFYGLPIILDSEYCC